MCFFIHFQDAVDVVDVVNVVDVDDAVDVVDVVDEVNDGNMNQNKVKVKKSHQNDYLTVYIIKFYNV